MGDSNSSGGPRNSGRNNQRRSGGGNRNSNRGGGNRGGGNRSGNDNREWKPSESRTPREPEPKPTFMQKVAGFFGFGKKEAPAPSQSRDEGRPQKKRSSDRPDKKGAERPPRKKREHTPVEVTSGRLFVGNLDYAADEAGLKAHFEQIGAVTSAEIVTNPHNGKPKGFAFVEMESIDDAKKAVAELHEKEFMSRRILVGGAKSRGKRTGGDGDRGGERRERPPRDRQPRDRNERSGGGDRRNKREPRKKPEHSDSKDPAMKPIAIETVTSPNLVISNLPSDFSAEDLVDLFDGIGTVSENEIGEGSTTVVMASVEDAQRSVELLDSKDFMGKRIRVKGNDGGAVVEAAPVSESTPTEEVKAESEIAEPAPAEEVKAESEIPEPAPAEDAKEQPETADPAPETTEKDPPAKE